MNMNELADRLSQEGLNPDYYCIGAGWHRLGNGFALDFTGEKFEWFYVERGQKSQSDITFSSEAEACDYAYAALVQDKWASSHLIGLFKTETEAQDLIERLGQAAIKGDMDHIPYGGLGDLRHRVFVYGRDIYRFRDLMG